MAGHPFGDVTVVVMKNDSYGILDVELARRPWTISERERLDGREHEGRSVGREVSPEKLALSGEADAVRGGKRVDGMDKE
jgi:hypothetical protein